MREAGSLLYPDKKAQRLSIYEVKLIPKEHAH
jgi:hypothetical protein